MILGNVFGQDIPARKLPPKLGIMSFLFFAGLSFILSGIVLVVFCLLLYLFIYNQEFYSTGKSREVQESFKNKGLGLKPVRIVNLILSILIPVVFGFIFYVYNDGFYKDVKLVESFNTANLQDVIKDISSNYIPLIIVIISALTVSALWFISILENRRKKN